MTDALLPDVASMLARAGVRGDETAMAHNGYSGARITAIEHRGERWLLKRIRYADDWLMRVTGDTSGREAAFAASSLVARLPAGVTVATVGACRDGEGYALLMRDVGAALLPDAGALSRPALDTIVERIAAMHVAFEGASLVGAVPFASVEARVLMLSPAVGRMLLGEGRDFGLARGWEVFARVAPPEAGRIVQRLFADPAPLLRLLASLPSTLLHGDLKCANMAIEADKTLCLLDWALVCHGPAAIDVAWLLAVNSSRIGVPLGDVLSSYIERRSGRASDERWQRERAAIMLCGLTLYGWGKALDAEAGGGEEFAWWYEGAIAAAASLGW